jgi:hypothetical protein
MCFAVSNEDMLVGRTDFRVDSTLSVLFSYLRILYDFVLCYRPVLRVDTTSQ